MAGREPVKEPVKVPRIICDKCMVDAEATVYVFSPHNELLLIRCHRTEELMRTSKLPGRRLLDPPKVVVLENLRRHFITPNELAAMEKNAVEYLLSHISSIQLYHRVRRAQGAPPSYFQVDEAMDTLFLFRRDPRVLGGEGEE